MIGRAKGAPQGGHDHHLPNRATQRLGRPGLRIESPVQRAGIGLDGAPRRQLVQVLVALHLGGERRTHAQAPQRIALWVVATRASRTRTRIAPSSGKDSSSSSRTGPTSGGGRFVSDGGRMTSMAACYAARRADGLWQWAKGHSPRATALATLHAPAAPRAVDACSRSGGCNGSHAGRDHGRRRARLPRFQRRLPARSGGARSSPSPRPRSPASPDRRYPAELAGPLYPHGIPIRAGGASSRRSSARSASTPSSSPTATSATRR